MLTVYAFLNRIFDYTPPDQRPPPQELESPLEEVLFLEAQAQGVYLTPQVWIGPYRVDFIIDDIVIEVDGKNFHPRLGAVNPENEGDVIAEYRRERYLLRHGWVIFRARGREVYHDAPGIVRELKQVIAARGQQ